MKPWYRAWVGAATDPKFHLVAALAEVSCGVAFLCWHHLLEDASKVDENGIFDVEPRLIAVSMREPIARIEAVFAAMIEVKMIARRGDGRGVVLKWSERQFTSDAPAAGTLRAQKSRAGHFSKRGGGKTADDAPLFEAAAEAGPATRTERDMEATTCNGESPLHIAPETESESDSEPSSPPRERARDASDRVKTGKAALAASPIYILPPSDRAPDLEARCRAMMGVHPAAADAYFVPILKLIDEGLTEEDVFLGVRNALAAPAHRRPKSWAAICGWVRQCARDRIGRAERVVELAAPPRVGLGNIRDGPRVSPRMEALARIYEEFQDGATRESDHAGFG